MATLDFLAWLKGATPISVKGLAIPCLWSNHARYDRLLRSFEGTIPPKTQTLKQKRPTPLRQATSSGSTELVAKPNSRRSKIKYVRQGQLDAELAKLEELSQAALAGDTAALDQLRAELDNCPHVWRRLTDLQQLVEHKLIELIAGIDPLRVEAFRKRCSALRHELLEGEGSSLLVKMAASRVVMCWMFCQFLELRALEDPQDLRCINSLSSLSDDIRSR